MLAKSDEECLQSDTSICTFYLLSSCTKGRKCPFLHDIPNNIGPESSGRKDPCYFFLKGRCNDGDSCQRSHSEPPSFNGTIKKVCLYFSQGRCDRGKLCSYNHDLPFYHHSPVSIIVDSESSSCQPENINVVSPVVINTSDDVQSMAVASKLCRFYLRGMCFFGENCTNFHDKPAKEPEDFISDLRENEVLNEKKALDGTDSFEKSDMNSNNLPVGSTKKGEIYFNASEVVRGCSNLSNQLKSCKDTSSSSKSEELYHVPFDGSSKPNELFTVSHCRFAKSAEIIEDPCESQKPTEINEDRDRSTKSFKISEDHRKSAKSTDLTEELCSNTKSIELAKEPSNFLKSTDLTKDLYNSSISAETTKYPCSSSNWSEFSRTSNTSSNSKFLRDTSSKSKEFFRESSTSSKTKELVKGTRFFSKSKGFARNNYSSNCKEFIKSKEYSRSKYTCSYSQSKKFSNSSYSFTKSKGFVRAQHSSKPKVLPSSRCVDNLIPAEHSKNTDVSLKSEELTRNSEILKKQSRNSSYPIKLEQCRNEVNSTNPIKQSKFTDDLKPIKAKEYFNIKNNPSNELSNVASSNSTSKTQVSLTGGFSKHTEPGKSFHMTRKQSKSQRKLKSENTQSRIFFKRLFFRTPVPVTHVTKT